MPLPNAPADPPPAGAVESSQALGAGRPVVASLYVLAFCSGAAALVYEVVWAKMLALTFGSTTLATAAGAPDIVGRLAVGDDLGTGTVKRAHIDGVDNLPYWTGKADESARRFHIYYAEANLQAVRYGAWKMHFYTRDGYYGTTTKLDLPWLFNVRQDPFESFDQAPGPRANLLQQKTYMFHFAIDLIQEHLASLIEYPPVQAAGTLSVGDIVKEIIESNPATNR